MRRSAIEAHVSGRAEELRQAFDRSFAAAPTVRAGTVEGLLTIRVGTNGYAVRLTDVSGLYADKKISPLPSPVPELRGIAGLRGTLLPVYDLGMLLGLPRAAAARWLLVTAVTPVGLAFDGFEGYASVAPEALLQVRGDVRERHVREVLQTERARPVIHVPSILETIRAHSGYDSQT
jgi:purine-binding chemotaxis protein CheW